MEKHFVDGGCGQALPFCGDALSIYNSPWPPYFHIVVKVSLTIDWSLIPLLSARRSFPLRNSAYVRERGVEVIWN
jgi:hypothetical protein